jgi:hypothetical protein
LTDYDLSVKTLQNHIPYSFKPKLTGFQAQVQQVEDFHGGFITAKGREEISYLKEKIIETKQDTFRWRKERSAYDDIKDIGYLIAKFSGRTTTKCAITEHKDSTERDDYLLTMFPVGWKQFDIHAEVPAAIKLLWDGFWGGTRDDIHFRKDIMRKIGIENETDDDKTCTFRWCFEPSQAKATANFLRAKNGTFGKKKNDFSLNEKQFIEGWARMQNLLFGSKTEAELDINPIKDWKQSIWWWTGRIEEETKKLLIGQGFRVANAFDCFYSSCSVEIIKEAIDSAANLVKKEFDAEKEQFIERWGHYSPNPVKIKKVRDNHAIAVKAAKTKRKEKEELDRKTTIDPITGKRVRKLKGAALDSSYKKAEKTPLSGDMDYSDEDSGSVSSAAGSVSSSSSMARYMTPSIDDDDTKTELTEPVPPETDTASEKAVFLPKSGAAISKPFKPGQHGIRDEARTHYIHDGIDYVRLGGIQEVLGMKRRIKTSEFEKLGITVMAGDEGTKTPPGYVIIDGKKTLTAGK